MKISPKQEAVLWSWLYAGLAAAAALYSAGIRDASTLGWAALAGVIAPVFRAVNKRNPEFGFVTKIAEEVVQTKVVKATAKKAPAKKAATK
jgi:hypothetical protein